MKNKKILEILKAHSWKEEEARASIQMMDHLGHCYPFSFLAYQKNLFSVVVYYFIKKNYAYERASAFEARKVFKWAWQKHCKNKFYFRKKIGEFIKIINQIDDLFLFISQGISFFSNKKLSNIYTKISELIKLQYGYSIIAESADTLEEKDFFQVLSDVKANNVLNLSRILSFPPQVSFLDKERLSLLKLAKIFFSLPNNKENKRNIFFKKLKNYPGIKKDLRNHAKNFFWVQNNFAEAKYLTENYFFKELKKILKEKNPLEIKQEINKIENKTHFITAQQKKVYKKYKISVKAKKFFELLQIFSLIQDKRKEVVLKFVYCLDQILKETAKRRQIRRSVLDYYTVQEVLQLIKNGKFVSSTDLAKRKKAAMISVLKNKKIEECLFFGKDAQEIIGFFEKKKNQQAKKNTISGFVVSRGNNKKNILRGMVRIVFNPNKERNFKKGEILVAGMTRPEFMPLMRQASAIITNEGGITTHASIVSREFGIPCIIGTKIATKFLKDGDLVEVDTDKGIIRKIK